MGGIWGIFSQALHRVVCTSAAGTHFGSHSLGGAAACYPRLAAGGGVTGATHTTSLITPHCPTGTGAVPLLGASMLKLARHETSMD